MRGLLHRIGDWLTRGNDLWGDSRYRPGPSGPARFADQGEAALPRFRLTGPDRDLDVVPLASFSVRGEILSRRMYNDDTASPISPIDLFVTWGDARHRDEMLSVEVRQFDRKCALAQRRVAGMREAELLLQCANIHLVPADVTVARPARLLSAGETVELSGQLVEITGRLRAVGTFRWRSSLSRDDLGEGACELLWLTRIHYRNREWSVSDPLP